ncbi:MAG: hypothetical protein PUB95_05205 [Methanobrevibacter ruminantium]|nr:hypothetical protein [Methanobrevibacter ruminantium]MDD6048833.1 hypothetical protein [Methanobrevibacter ruminantium]
MMQCSGITKVPELEERISNGTVCLWIMEQADQTYSPETLTM